MSRRRLLIVSPAFAPHPSPSMQRTRFVARYAPDNGWDPHVVSVDPMHYEESIDPELERLLPAGLRITRTRAWPARWTRRFGVGDLGMRSYAPMRRVLRDVCRRERPDLVYIPLPPWHTALLGADMRREFGIPYVLDYTDPWVFAIPPAQNRPTRKAYWFRRMAEVLEPRAVRNAAHIFAVSDGTNDGIRARHPEIPGSRFSAAPFGFEPEDFEALRRAPRPNPYWDRGDGDFHIVYAGAMLPHAYETLRAVFGAALQLREREPSLGRRLRFHFFGTTYAPTAGRGLVLPVAQEMGIAGQVSEVPLRIPYVDALNVLTSADAVLGMGSTEKHYTASKIFPSILSRRPVLAVYHEASSVCDVMRATGAGELVTYDDVQRAELRVPEIAAAIRRIADGTTSASRSLSLAALDEYSAARITARMFALCHRIVDERNGPAPAVGAPAAHLAHA